MTKHFLEFFFANLLKIKNEKSHLDKYTVPLFSTFGEVLLVTITRSTILSIPNPVVLPHMSGKVTKQEDCVTLGNLAKWFIWLIEAVLSFILKKCDTTFLGWGTSAFHWFLMVFQSVLQGLCSWLPWKCAILYKRRFNPLLPSLGKAAHSRLPDWNVLSSYFDCQMSWLC